MNSREITGFLIHFSKFPDSLKIQWPDRADATVRQRFEALDMDALKAWEEQVSHGREKLKKLPSRVSLAARSKPSFRSIRREPDHYSFGNRREIRSGSRQMLLSEWVAKVSGLRLFIRQHKTAHALRNRQRR